MPTDPCGRRPTRRPPSRSSPARAPRPSTVISSQLSSLSTSTTLVSITIGGNDAGFSSIMESCVLDSTSTCRESDISKASDTQHPRFPATSARCLPTSRPTPRTPNSSCSTTRLLRSKRSGLHRPVAAAGFRRPWTTASTTWTASFRPPAPTTPLLLRRRPRFRYQVTKLSSDNAGWLNPCEIFEIHTSYHRTATGQADGYLPVFTAAANAVGQ